MVELSRESAKDGFVSSTMGDGLGWMFSIEPLTTILGPRMGPDHHLLLMMIKNIFDPDYVMNPGKLIRKPEIK
jgi:hypothetical protein